MIIRILLNYHVIKKVLKINIFKTPIEKQLKKSVKEITFDNIQ